MSDAALPTTQERAGLPANGTAGEVPPWLAGLNPPQREAVLTTEGPVLMLAGAGTGKTAALTARLAWLVGTRKAWPSEILCVTFTNKAAREMRERVGRLIGDAVEGMPWLGTFHSICARMLRRHAELVGLQSNYTIIDTDDQLRVMKALIVEQDLDEKRWPARQLAGLIDGWKNRGLNPGDLDAVDNEAFANGKGQKLYELYQARLKFLNACDFGDLLLHMLNILRRHPDVLELYRKRFKYILVDEYQDTNAVQYLWLRLLAQERRNICVVGDDDQSIYSWRGAEVANILRFEKDFPGAKVIRLEQNYRSTPQILAAASGLIAANSQRLGKTLWTELHAGEQVRVIGVWDGPEEARRVGEEIERLEREGLSLDQVAILVRAQYQTREFEDRFIQIGLNYKIIGGFRFYERAEIRDALAYLRMIAQPADDLAFERIYNQPKRGLGAKTLEAMHRHARATGLPLAAAALELADTDELPARARGTISALMRSFLRWRGMAEAATPSELLRTVLEESGYDSMLAADRSAESAGRADNLVELQRAMEEYDTLGDFLEHVSLVMDNDAADDGEKVTIMTIHAAKGLEFDHVFLPGWEEGVFPSQRSLDEGGLAAPRGRAPAGLCRDHAGAAALHDPSRGEPAHLWPVDQFNPLAASLPSCRTRTCRAVETTLSGGASLWRAQLDRERSDPFADVARAQSGTRRSRPRAGLAAGGRRQSYEPNACGALRETITQRRQFRGQAAQATLRSATGCSTTSSVMAVVARARKATSSRSISSPAGRKRVIDSFVKPA